MSEARVQQQARRIHDLLAENERLQARVDALETLLVADVDTFQLGELTRKEQMLVGFLMRRPLATKDQIHTFLYADSIADDDVAEPKIVDVYVCKVRKKLKPLGVEIQNHFGRGYSLPPASKAILARKAEQFGEVNA